MDQLGNQNSAEKQPNAPSQSGVKGSGKGILTVEVGVILIVAASAYRAYVAGYFTTVQAELIALTIGFITLGMLYAILSGLSTKGRRSGLGDPHHSR